MKSKQELLERIQKISDAGGPNIPRGSYVYTSTLALAVELYGKDSPRAEVIRCIYENRLTKPTNSNDMYQTLVEELKGVLRSIQDDVEHGLFTAIRTEAEAGVYADFVALAKEASENGGKDVAAVLACAALEDALKKHAEANNLDVDGKDMSGVISTLKAGGLIGKPQSKLLQAHTTLRNKAMHAEWDKVSEPDVRSLIAYLEGFVLEHFSGDFYTQFSN